MRARRFAGLLSPKHGVDGYDAAACPPFVSSERIDQVAHTPRVVLSNVRVNYLSQNGQNWVMFGDVATCSRAVRGGRVGQRPAASESADPLAGRGGAQPMRSLRVTGSIASTKSDVRIDFGAQSLTGRGSLRT